MQAVRRMVAAIGVVVVLILGVLPLTGLVLATAAPAVGARSLTGVSEQPLAFGDATDQGTVSLVAEHPFVGMAATPDSHGYWFAGSDGGVFAYGDAGFYGSAGNLHLRQPVVGMAATPDGEGYWLVASDGGIFAFGDARFYGSMGGMPLAEPVVGMAATPDGKGYWLVGDDGGVFAFGDAQYLGRAEWNVNNQCISARTCFFGPVAIASTHDGKGYWMVGINGNVLTFGDAVNYGGVSGRELGGQIVGITPTPDGGGYWLVGSDGGVFTFGDAGFYGSTGGQTLFSPVIGLASAHDGTGYWLATTVPLAPAGTPVLGWQGGVDQEGFGYVMPPTVFFGGDPTGLVQGITWSTWGGARATGTGTGYYVPPTAPDVAAGFPANAVITASDLGDCGGRLMYEEVTWSFPGRPGGSGYGSGFNFCTGNP